MFSIFSFTISFMIYEQPYIFFKVVMCNKNNNATKWDRLGPELPKRFWLSFLRHIIQIIDMYSSHLFENNSVKIVAIIKLDDFSFSICNVFQRLQAYCCINKACTHFYTNNLRKTWPPTMSFNLINYNYMSQHMNWQNPTEQHQKLVKHFCNQTIWSLYFTRKWPNTYF